MSSKGAWSQVGVEVEVLVVASPTESVNLLCEELRGSGFRPRMVTSLAGARTVLRDGGPRFAIIQLALSDGCGLDLLPATDDAGIAAIILSSDAAPKHLELAFRAGADDVVTEPVDVAWLVMRITAMLRRSGASLPRKITFDGLEIDIELREVTANGAAVELTAREFDLLAFLAAHPGRVFNRQQLLESVWHSSAEWQLSSTVTEHIRRLRIRIEDDPSRPRWLRTSRGVGYRFDRRAFSSCGRRDGEEPIGDDAAADRVELCNA